MDAININDPEAELILLQILENERQWREKPWQQVYKGMVKYLKDNLHDVHPAKLELQRVEQILRNVRGWRTKLNSEDPQRSHPEQKLFISQLDDVMEQLKERITYLKEKPKEKTATRTQKTFEDYFTVRDPEGLKGYLRTLHVGKELAHAVEYLRSLEKGSIEKDYLSFLRTLNPAQIRDTGLAPRLSVFYRDEIEWQKVQKEIDRYC